MPEPNRLSSGVGQLDQYVGGLFVGDNVVWQDHTGSLAWVFCQNFLQVSRDAGKPIIYVSFDYSPKVLFDKLGALADYANLTVLDCFTHGKGESSPIFLKFYQHPPETLQAKVIQVKEPRDSSRVSARIYGIHETLEGDVRLVFDSLTGMQELWGGEDEIIKFYSSACPRLYELETIAYWVMEKDAHSSRLKAIITKIAQVVIELSIKRGATFLTILKAAGRDTTFFQKSLTYWAKGRQITFDSQKRSTGGLNLGSRIKELRTKKALSQTDLAKLVGVTPSTISQVESNLIYPSLPAMLKMAEVLGVEVGSFFSSTESAKKQVVFSGEDQTTIRLPSHFDQLAQAIRLTPIDFDGKIEPCLVEVSPDESLPVHFFTHKGEEFGYLLSGRLELKLGPRVFNLEPGQVVYLTTESPSSWKNPGREPARLLWVKIL
ncbi:MAG: helix-turn-helix domain-containing protein [Pseudomonadota bacterium]